MSAVSSMLARTRELRRCSSTSSSTSPDNSRSQPTTVATMRPLSCASLPKSTAATWLQCGGLLYALCHDGPRQPSADRGGSRSAVGPLSRERVSYWELLGFELRSEVLVGDVAEHAAGKQLQVDGLH